MKKYKADVIGNIPSWINKNAKKLTVIWQCGASKKKETKYSNKVKLKKGK